MPISNTARSVSARHPRQGQRHADVVVVALDRRVGRAGQAQARRDRLGDAGLADRAGDGAAAAPAARARGRRRPASPAPCRVSATMHGRAVDRPATTRAPAAPFGQGLGHELMAVAHAGQGHEQVAGLDACGCRWRRRWPRRPRRCSRPPVAAAISSEVQSGSAMDQLQGLGGLGHVVEGMDRRRRRSGPAHGPCRPPPARRRRRSSGDGRARMASRRSPISSAPGAPARTSARMAAGSSRRGLSSVTMATSASARGDLAHQRALAAVAVAAGAEHHDQLAARVRAQRLQHRLQAVRRVGVVDIGLAAARRRRRRAAAGPARPRGAPAPPSTRRRLIARRRCTGPPPPGRWRPGSAPASGRRTS